MSIPNPIFLLSLGWTCDANDVWTHPVTPGEFDETTAIEVTRRAMTGYRDNVDPDWKPSLDDQEWQEDLVRKLRDRGEWSVPGAFGSTWRVFKEEKIAMLISGDPKHTTNERIAMVFIAMGWNVGFGDQLKETQCPE